MAHALTPNARRFASLVLLSAVAMVVALLLPVFAGVAQASLVPPQVLVVPAPMESIGSGINSGAVTLLAIDGAGGTVESALHRQGARGVGGRNESGDHFGSSFTWGDLDGDGVADLVVGAPGEDIGSSVDAGAITVLYGAGSGSFSRSAVFHQGTAKVIGVNETGDGWSTSLASGDLNNDGYDDVAVGAPGEDIGADIDVGAVTILYGGPGGLTGQGSELLHQDSPAVPGAGETGDGFGQAVAIGGSGSSTFLAVSAPFEDLKGTTDAGSVTLFDVVGSELVPERDLVFAGASAKGSRPAMPHAPGTGDQLGLRLAASSSGTLLIGAPSADLAGATDAGYVISYNSSTGFPSATFLDQGVTGSPESGGRFGDAIDIDIVGGETTLAIGSPGHSDGSAASGAITVIGSNGLATTFTQESSGVPGRSETGDMFGGYVDLLPSGVMLVGAPGEDIGSHIDVGAGVVFTGTPSDPIRDGAIVLHQNSPGVASINESGDQWGLTLGSAPVGGPTPTPTPTPGPTSTPGPTPTPGPTATPTPPPTPTPTPTPTGPDTTPPTTTFSTPGPNETVQTSSVIISGVANDNIGVQTVDLRLRDLSSGLYLQEDGSFGAAQTWLATAIGQPGSNETTWSRTATLTLGLYEIVARSVDTSGNAGAEIQQGFLVVDGEAPSTPTGVTAAQATSSTITLSWPPSVDSFGQLEGYRVFRNGVFVGVSLAPATTFEDTTLASQTGYIYEVSAFDSAGNESARSAPLSASSLAVNPLVISDITDPTWDVDGILHTILPVGDTIYIGGEFSSLSSGGSTVSRNNLAAIDRITGAPTPFNPNLDDIVNALAVSPDGTTLYAGGTFTTVGAISKRNLASFDIASGALRPFPIEPPNRSVRAIATDGETIYVGGTFDKIGAVNRGLLAAFDAATGELSDTWLPTVDNQVKDILIDPDKVWVAGNFRSVNGTSIVGLVALDRDLGTIVPTVTPIYPVLDIAAKDNQLFAAGAGPGGQIASYDRTTGAELWIYMTDGNVQAVDIVGDYAYYGGHYPHIGNVEVGRLTRHDPVTGELDPTWLPDVNGVRSVNTLAVDDDNVYIGGDFTFVSGERQGGFAQFERKTLPELAPQLVDIVMKDVDVNGYVDTVEVIFDRPLGPCTSPCLAGWDVKNVPSDGTLASVEVVGNTAIMHFTEGPGDIDTGVSSFQIKLDRGYIDDGQGRSAKILFTKPTDAVSPMIVNLLRTNIGTSGLPETGDTLIAIWSEPVSEASYPTTTNVVIDDLADGANDLLTIEGVIDGVMDLGSDGYIVCATTPCAAPEQVVFVDSVVSFTNNGTRAQVTLGVCTGACDLLERVVQPTVTYVAAPTLSDVAGNAPVGSFTKTLNFF